MAMTKCRECGSEISDKAASCPKCGAPLRETDNSNSPLATGIKVASILMFAVGILLVVLGLTTIEGDRYTYKPPLTDHEINTLLKTYLGAIMIGGSLGLDIIVIRKTVRRNNENVRPIQVNHETEIIQPIGVGGKVKCPLCGLEQNKERKSCARCHARFDL